jgi:hypothetical protein
MIACTSLQGRIRSTPFRIDLFHLPVDLQAFDLCIFFLFTVPEPVFPRP